MTSSQELHRIEEEGRFQQEPAEKPIDWDRIFAYKTYKVVRIMDRYLGMTYWAIVTAVIMYIIIFAIGIEGRHQYQEPGIGTVITRYKGKAFADGKAFDQADLRFPEVEPFGAFIMTKVVTVKNQKIGSCVDYTNPCPCAEGSSCVDGYCQEKAWCPSLGEGNMNSPEASGGVVTKLTGIEHTVLKVLAGIAFPGIGNYFYVMGKTEEGFVELPHEKELNFRNITVKQLLEAATPPVKLEEVLDTGALISVSFLWNCDVMSIFCKPRTVIKRLDNGAGFFQQRAQRHTVGGAQQRDATVLFGLRILVDSTGIGRRVSFVMIVIQIGSGLALLRTASMCADFLMLYLYPKRRREAYYRCKIQETHDFSDLQDRLNLIQEFEEKKKKSAELIASVAHESEGGRNLGIHELSLGLGGGGRGGKLERQLQP